MGVFHEYIYILYYIYNIGKYRTYSMKRGLTFVGQLVIFFKFTWVEPLGAMGNMVPSGNLT